MPGMTELETLIQRLAAIDYSQGSEQATREMAVNPVIGALGWDTFDPSEVAREYSVRGGRVDYCLRGQGRNLVLVEVKKAGTELTEHQEQLLRYAFDEGVPMAALTDGLTWWLYLPMAGGSWEQRRFSRLNFRELGAAQAASALSRFLDHDASIRGEAQQEAQREFESQERDRRVRAALQDAWHEVLEDSDGLLRDLLSETVAEISGHQPDDDTIAEFLRGVVGGESTDADLSSQRRATEAKTPRRPRRRSPVAPSTQPTASHDEPPEADHAASAAPAKLTGQRPAAYWLDDTRHEVKSWRVLLQRLCDQLCHEVGSAAFIERVAALRGRRRPYFSSSASELREPLPIRGIGLSVEGNQSANSAVRLARLTLQAVRGNDESFRIELADVSGGQSPPISPAGQDPTSFSGRRVAAFWLDGDRHEVGSWPLMVQTLSEQLMVDVGPAFTERVATVRGRTRSYFSEQPDDLTHARRLGDSNLYVEGNLGPDAAARVARQTLTAVRGSSDGFRIELAE